MIRDFTLEPHILDGRDMGMSERQKKIVAMADAAGRLVKLTLCIFEHDAMILEVETMGRGGG